MFIDQPAYWDAWGETLSNNCCMILLNIKIIADVEIYHLETTELLRFEELNILADGPLRASVAAKVRYGKSTIDVTVS